MSTSIIAEVARFDDLQPGETVWFEDWPWPQTVARVETDGHIFTVYTEEGGRPYEGAWFAEVTRELATQSGTIRPATLVGLLFALVPMTLLLTFSARLAGMLAGTVGGVA